MRGKEPPPRTRQVKIETRLCEKDTSLLLSRLGLEIRPFWRRQMSARRPFIMALAAVLLLPLVVEAWYSFKIAYFLAWGAFFGFWPIGPAVYNHVAGRRERNRLE